MFSPATKKSNYSVRKDLQQRSSTLLYHESSSPITPLAENNAADKRIPNRPSTGTPAPWASRLSVLARISPIKKSEKEESDPVKPVFVGELPQVVRDEQDVLLQKRIPGNFSGGMDKETLLAWIICGNKLFVWSYLSTAASRNCVVLNIPPSILEREVGSTVPASNWILSVVSWDVKHKKTDEYVQQCRSAGIILCNQTKRAILYWPDIYAEGECAPHTNSASGEELKAISSPSDGKPFTPSRQRHLSRLGSSSTGSSFLNSLIACPIPEEKHTCVALACVSNGELLQFYCSPNGIIRHRIYEDIFGSTSHDSNSGQLLGGKGYGRSLIWRFSNHQLEEKNRQFFLLTDHEIQCLAITPSPNITVKKLWSHEIVGADGDLGIQKNLAGQKRIWPLDLQVDIHGKVITVLIATYCNDRFCSSSYIEYSLLTMHYRSGVEISEEKMATSHDRILEKRVPIQVIIPKARVEEEDFLFSMRLRVGGKPSGSAIILSGDGTATVSHYWRNSTRLYRFDLPYDAGKVLDTSVFPSSDDGEDGAWAVLTEKAGIWAIPEKAVLLGGVEPPERSLSRKGSSNEGATQEEKRTVSFGGNVAPRRASSEAGDAGDRQRAVFAGMARPTAQDEESEALLNHLFYEFLLSAQVDNALDKLTSSGAFEREGEANIFSRVSKSIIDTLAKHWTTTRGAEIVSLATMATQLTDKLQKHNKFLQFLALSKCHEELSLRQRQSLQIIMEHGEKLAAMIQLRELQSLISQNRSSGVSPSYSSPESEISGALWDLIQLVGERARRNIVLLMDRDNAEVLYSKVSDLEELFYCLDKHLGLLISSDTALVIQLERACELSKACVVLIRTAMNYRNEYNMWYPPPEGLAPWNSQPKVRSGMWSVASFMLQLVPEVSQLDISRKSDFHSNLEALAEVLLEAYSSAIMAKVDREDDHRGLSDEYWSRRDSLLNSLYHLVKSITETRYQDLHKATEEQRDVIFKEVSAHLMYIAKRNQGYQTMWNICCDVNDSELLKNLMHESMGPTDGFSHFVFKQMYKSKQFSELMRLGEEFPEELDIFLKQHRDLLWLHQVHLHQYSAVSETLHELALSQEADSVATVADGINCEVYNKKQTLAERKRFLNLSKIAAVAGKSADYDKKLMRIEADMKILKLQEVILKALPDEEKQNIGTRLLSPVDLIELCLKTPNRDLSLYAFDIFAWTSSSFIRCNRSLLEECWRNVANQEDWSKIYQTSTAEGWSDEETLQVLRETMLFRASSRCYGPEMEAFEGGFDEILPLRQDNLEISNNVGSSVEAILMQHKDFAEAGKLMLTSIMLGGAQSEDSGVDDGSSPME